ncbi:hypothetical protein ACJJIE_17725 [Microbulbifer sp. TRSA001]|uniref:hypothetical protein n=1 Tax=Microbulbifer sp. TRSA001 TaxID=3243381 RepID=UPI004039F108
MITYKFPEEKEYAEFYAKKLDDEFILQFLQYGIILNKSQAEHICRFFWAMVDASIEDENNGVKLQWNEGAEFWNEKIMNSISARLEALGYEEEWENEVDKQ